MGRIFIQKASGHMLNQHYLQSMFTLNPTTGVGCAETNPFMEQHISTNETPEDVINRRATVIDSIVGILEDGMRVDRGANVRNVGTPQDIRFPNVQRRETGSLQLKVKDLSRLWLYRNGMIPKEDARKLSS